MEEVNKFFLPLQYQNFPTGLHDQTTSRLLSHELGHLFGSDHDGTKPMNPHSIYMNDGIKKYVKLSLYRKIQVQFLAKVIST